MEQRRPAEPSPRGPARGLERVPLPARQDRTTLTTRLRSPARTLPPATTTKRPEAGGETAQRWSARSSFDAGMRRAIDECIALLEQGRALIEAIEDEDYVEAPSAIDTPDAVSNAWSSPGAHTRHLLEFVGCLLRGLDARRVDYTARRRRADLETSRAAARREIADAIEGLQRVRALPGDQALVVRPEPEQDWTRSTLAREVQFVSSHAVHHHALIRMTLSHRGVEAPPEYGVAPSTLAYEARQRDGGDA